MKTDYTALLRELAVPRLVGTSNHALVREVLKRELSARGFTVEEHAFEGRPSFALLGAPAVVHGTNLIAVRPAARPSVWLVAHYDSKGQPISMAVRLGGFFALGVGLLLLTVSFIPALVILAVALFVLLRNRVTDNSPGAVDNATALIAIFMAIDQLTPHARVGVIFPDAEELGLVGARALARDRAPLLQDAAVINLDGLDDTGRVTAFVHRPGSTSDAVAKAVDARRWRWLPVIVDGIALARASRECITILKGNWRTMMSVHRPEDSADRLRLDGAALVAAGLARVLRAG
ncbi:MAG TPA: M28 family peptidase [Gemmatimonadales bacterium]|nr:M28 family peptidase [Gemmatimonadales bacterium]